MSARRAEEKIAKSSYRKRAMAWYHNSGHRWSYDSDETVGSMVVRFSEWLEPVHDSCGCSCGFCNPTRPHHAEDGCVCELLSCPCID